MFACVDRTRLPWGSARFAYDRALGFDAGHQVVPRLVEGRGAVVLKLLRQRIDVNAGARKGAEHLLAIASVRRQRRADFAVLREGLERAIGHSVDREGCRERLHIKYVGGFGILVAGAGPKEALCTGAGVGDTLKASRSDELQIRLIGTLGDGNTEPIAQLARGLTTDCDVPAANKDRGDRGHCRVQPRLDASLDSAQVGLGRRDILLAREQQRDIDWNAGKDRFLDRRHTLRRAWNLDEEVRFAPALVEVARGG